jgi:hypothetical protein
MTIELLIQCLVRQMTILIAQLATTGGARAPLAQVANQVFLDLVDELNRQGVGRKISADMFGMGLRTYQRRIQRLLESSTDRGQSLWQSVLDHICRQKMVSRSDIQKRFSNDDPAQIRGLLRDLCDSGLVFSTGQGDGTLYRAASEDELQAFRQVRSSDGLEELVWAILYHSGPVTMERLLALTRLEESELSPTLARLVETNRVEVQKLSDGQQFRASPLFVPIGASAGWEAAVFDHFQAMVKTICCRLREDRTGAHASDLVGGSTFSLDVWPGHPLEEEVCGTLGKVRQMIIELRHRADAYNATHEIPERHKQVVIYVGQTVISQGTDHD